MARKSNLVATAFRSEHGRGTTASRHPAWPTGRASLIGAGLGGWLGLLTGLILALLPGAPQAAALLGGPLVGAAIGAMVGLLVHWATDARQAVTAQAVTAPAVTAQAVTAQAVTAPAVTAQAVTAPAVTAPAVIAPAAPAAAPPETRGADPAPTRPAAMRLERTHLPRLGTAYAFDTAGGQRFGVLVHPSGRRDMMSFDPDDLDRVLHVTELAEAEARTVAHLLGFPVLLGEPAEPSRSSGTGRVRALAGSRG
ncbi:hypothetical protein Ait01nite_015910 [Actinoplanes italicus]|uniref:Potassium/proton antiporter subunit KhtT-like N-terminal domain-containing protein n=2 Tax=Actinoplanes italicus TaxID=113567 RepID=A0A2T0KIF1_9ACTN|nr:hypothetical protein CLV67_104555 [Actinoplanes italicus]GIE28546.1 hypothetical protein Ait01nite_015910 [Actinoplanes italicus]